MTRARLFVLASVLTCALFIGLAGPAAARPFWGRASVGRTYYRPAYNYVNSGHMPGWDWWRTYPWSSYNAWRNPYWYPPYNYSYPYAPYEAYPSSYVYPAGDTTYSSGYSGLTPPEDGMPSAPQQRVLVPHPTGALRSPPPNAGVIRVYVPSEFATVRFDGAQSSSVGTTRYYVTPDLEAGKKYNYDISATFTRNGQPVTEDRHVTVAPGQTTVVDFNRSSAK
jgi:uncharacterized protein (TIGR03000 family)